MSDKSLFIEYCVVYLPYVNLRFNLQYFFDIRSADRIGCKLYNISNILYGFEDKSNFFFEVMV